MSPSSRRRLPAARARRVRRPGGGGAAGRWSEQVRGAVTDGCVLSYDLLPQPCAVRSSKPD